MKRIPRRIFTAEFKREAIKSVTEQGLTMTKEPVRNILNDLCRGVDMAVVVRNGRSVLSVIG